MKTTQSRAYKAVLGTALMFGLSSLNHTVQSQSPLKANNDRAKPIPSAPAVPVAPTSTEQDLEQEKQNPPTDIVSELTDVSTLQTNDPFANTFAMLKRATAENPITTTLSAMTGSSDLQLKGTVVDTNQQALALLEVGRTGVHVVRVGDTLSLSGGGRSSNVTILAIHRQSIEVEYGNFEDSIIIR